MSQLAQFQIGEPKFVYTKIEPNGDVGGEGNGDELVVYHRLEVPGNNEQLGSSNSATSLEAGSERFEKLKFRVTALSLANNEDHMI